MKDAKARGPRAPSKNGNNRFKYFPNNNNDNFRFHKECQNLTAEVFKATNDAPKGFRFSILKKVTDICCDLIFTVRLANNYPLGGEERKVEQQNVMEQILKLEDLLPVLRKCRCVSLGQEGDITKRIGNLKHSFENWLESDEKRIEQMGK